MECVTLLDASVEEGFHLLAGNFAGCLGAETHQFVADGLEQQTGLGALDDQRVNIEQLNVGEQAARVFLSDRWVCLFMSVGVSADQPGVEQTATASGVGDRKRNAAEGSLVVVHGLMFGFVVHLNVLCGFWEVELFDVLTETRGQVAHQEIGLLDGFLWIDQTVLHLGANDGVGQSWRCWVCAPGRATIGLGVVASKQVVEDVTGVGEEVGWKGRPVFGKKGSNGLEGLEGLFPCGQPDVDLLFAVVKTSVQSCIPTTNPVLQCPHQTDGTAFSL